MPARALLTQDSIGTSALLLAARQHVWQDAPIVPESLASMLRQRRADHLISDAEYIRAHPDGPERTAQAEIVVREAMYLQTIGRMTQEEESRVFSILCFVMPNDAAEYYDWLLQGTSRQCLGTKW